jgi:uncharacterized protein (DUF2141 family)
MSMTPYRRPPKRFALILVIAVGFAVPPLGADSQVMAQPDEIRIVVSGVRNHHGSVICSIWAGANSDQFTKTGTATQKLSVPIQAGQAVCASEGLPAGAYAATVFHDENGDGKFNKKFGYPLEGYGFTNNVRPTVKAPSFDECKIQYSGKGVVNVPTIYMIYR